jgi:hypothetical protein
VAWRGLPPAWPYLSFVVAVIASTVLFAPGAIGWDWATGRTSLSRIDGTLSDTVVRTNGMRGGRSYQEYESMRLLHPGGKFHGFTCFGSCAGHKAGYRWAEDGDVVDADECRGNSWAFTEGCIAFFGDSAK